MRDHRTAFQFCFKLTLSCDCALAVLIIIKYFDIFNNYTGWGILKLFIPKITETVPISPMIILRGALRVGSSELHA